YDAETVMYHPLVLPQRHPEYYRYNARNRVWLARRNLPWPLAVIYLTNWILLTLIRERPLPALKAWFGGLIEGIREPAGERRPMAWQTAGQTLRHGRPPNVKARGASRPAVTGALRGLTGRPAGPRSRRPRLSAGRPRSAPRRPPSVRAGRRTPRRVRASGGGAVPRRGPARPWPPAATGHPAAGARRGPRPRPPRRARRTARPFHSRAAPPAPRGRGAPW